MSSVSAVIDVGDFVTFVKGGKTYAGIVQRKHASRDLFNVYPDPDRPSFWHSKYTYYRVQGGALHKPADLPPAEQRARFMVGQPVHFCRGGKTYYGVVSRIKPTNLNVRPDPACPLMWHGTHEYHVLNFADVHARGEDEESDEGIADILTLLS
jgi:hypothetical protein